MEVIKHFTHQHELSLSEKKTEDNIRCKVCYEYCDEGVMIYSCRESDCRFTLHESCAKLPQELHNPLLHPHPLSLKRPENKFFEFKCNGCGKISWGFSFHCDKCDVNLDVKCGFIRPAMEEGEEAVVVGTHFSHRQHPWVPLENIPASHIRCSVCGKYCSDPKTYGCLQCGIFLHPSCLNLPEEIFHPFHPYHRLTLKPIKDIDHYHPRTPKRIKDDDDDAVKCNACRRDIYGDEYFGCVAYFCKCCNNTKTSFCLDAECASVIMPAITYEGHDHLLLFLDIDRKVDELIKNCSACKSSTCESYGFRYLDLHFDDNIGDERIKCSACKSTCESYAFRCLDLHCDFNLHLSCGPLPYTIQHKSHIHPLILTICPIEDEKDCEPDEFYCNVCEKERDPFLPIYYCKECPFVAGISCVISEVVSLLKGEHGDVELRNPFGQFGNLIREKQELVTKPALTLFDIFNSLSKAEKSELNHNLERVSSWVGNKEFWEIITSEDQWTEFNFEVDEAYTKFMKFVDIGIEIPIEFRDTKEDVQIPDFKFCYKLRPEEEVVDLEDYKITRKLAPILKDMLSKHGAVSTAWSTLSPNVKLYFLHMLCECIYSMINTKVVDITTNDLLNWWTILEISKWVDFRIQFASDHLKRVALAHFGLSAEKQGSNVLDQLATDIEALKRKLERLTSIKSILIKKCAEASMLKGWKAGVGLLKAGDGLL
ncbi:uncharacterized protein LOC132187350 [Corylus avellana]|uniref:uncharacterized protein LOC132187350 n=1 Tax=Corylus avellana TaxID=13451 RepID=UPI00286ADB9A|nr:uncharacterized protein LOC132187350 [Corylus avellana]